MVWDRVNATRLLIYLDAGTPEGRYELRLSYPDGRSASAAFEVTAATRPGISLRFVERLDPGVLPNVPPEFVPYRFSVFGVALEEMRTDDFRAMVAVVGLEAESPTTSGDYIPSREGGTLLILVRSTIPPEATQL